MIYLAEVSKKNKIIPWRSKTELKLLACQLSSQNWNILSESRTITIEEVCHFPEGTLLKINIVNETKVEGKIEVAKPYILKILREQENIIKKCQQEQQNIKLWQQSLIYQSEELETQKKQLEQKQLELQIKEAELNNLNIQSKSPKSSNISNSEGVISSRKMLGQLLHDANLISEAQLEIALSTQADYPEFKIGSILVLRGWIKTETVDFFTTHWQSVFHQKPKHPIGYYFKQAALLNEEQIKSLLAEQKTIKLRFGEIAILKGWLKQKTLNFFLEHLNQVSELSLKS